MAKARAVSTKTVALLEHTDTILTRLKGPLPFTIPANEYWRDTAEFVDDIFIGDAEIRRRATSEPAPPDGGDDPYISPDNMFLLDVVFMEKLVLFSKEVEYGLIGKEL